MTQPELSQQQRIEEKLGEIADHLAEIAETLARIGYYQRNGQDWD